MWLQHLLCLETFILLFFEPMSIFFLFMCVYIYLLSQTVSSCKDSSNFSSFAERNVNSTLYEHLLEFILNMYRFYLVQSLTQVDFQILSAP